MFTLPRIGGGILPYVSFPARRPQAQHHRNRAAGVCHAVVRLRPGHPTQVFGQGGCARASLAARADPIGFGRGVVELYVGECLLGRLQLRAATAIVKL